MDVQELIDELLKVKDKSIKVKVDLQNTIDNRNKFDINIIDYSIDGICNIVIDI